MVLLQLLKVFNAATLRLIFFHCSNAQSITWIGNSSLHSKLKKLWNEKEKEKNVFIACRGSLTNRKGKFNRANAQYSRHGYIFVKKGKEKKTHCKHLRVVCFISILQETTSRFYKKAASAKGTPRELYARNVKYALVLSPKAQIKYECDRAWKRTKMTFLVSPFCRETKSNLQPPTQSANVYCQSKFSKNS